MADLVSWSFLAVVAVVLIMAALPSPAFELPRSPKEWGFYCIEFLTSVPMCILWILVISIVMLKSK